MMKDRKITVLHINIALIINIFFLMTSSCSTIFNKKIYSLSISSDLPNSSVIIDSNNYKLPADVAVIRSNNELPFTVLQNDTIVNDTILKPRVSEVYWLGNILYPQGWLIDLTNNKRFTYSNRIHINSSGKVTFFNPPDKLFSNKYFDLYFHKHKERNINLLLSIYEANLFHLSPQNKTSRIFAGFLGPSIGVEYFYKNNKSVQLRGDATMSSTTAPVPKPYDWDNSQATENCYALNLSLTDNYQWKRFQFGYGLNLAKNILIRHSYYIEPQKPSKANYEDEQIDGITKHNTMLGFVSNAYYRFSNYLYFGVIYRPSFWNLSSDKSIYEHSIGFDFMLKIHLKTK